MWWKTLSPRMERGSLSQNQFQRKTVANFSTLQQRWWRAFGANIAQVSIPSRNAHAGIAPPPPFHVCIPMGIITVTIKTIVINVLVLKSQSNKIFRQNPWNGFDHLGKARIAQQPPSLGCIPTNIIESMELAWFNYSPGKSLVHFFYNECFEHKEPLYDLYALDSSGIQNI